MPIQFGTATRPLRLSPLILGLHANGEVRQSQILIAKMSDADGIHMREDAGGGWLRADRAYFYSINSRYFQT
jgi:hypothetical protein